MCERDGVEKSLLIRVIFTDVCMVCMYECVGECVGMYERGRVA